MKLDRVGNKIMRKEIVIGIDYQNSCSNNKEGYEKQQNAAKEFL